MLIRRTLILRLCLLEALLGLAGGAADAQPAEALQDELFNPAILHEIHMSVHPRDWDSLRANFSENTYYAADLQWRNITAAQIGIRSRGSGSRSGVKPGLRIDFNRFTSGQRFLGLNALVLDNCMQDQSFVRERLSMLLFERMGVPAPRVGFARLYINGQFFGLYTIVEEINKDFLNRVMGGESGWLYEYRWTQPYFYEDRGPAPDFYLSIFSPKTREKDPRIDRLYSIISFVGSAGDEEFAAGIGRLIDVPGYLRLSAVEALLADWDGQFGEEGVNNFYVYLAAEGEPLRWIAWDKDVTLWDPAYPILPQPVQNRILARLLSFPEYREIYFGAVSEAALMAGGAGGTLDQAAEEAYTLIRASVAEDVQRQATMDEFEADYQSLRDFLAARVESVFVQMTALRAGAR